MSARPLAALVLVLAPLAACSTGTDDMALLHREITDVQREVQQARAESLDKHDLQTMESRLQEMSAQTMRSNADLAAELRRLQEEIEGLHASLELTTRQLQDISQELAATRPRMATGATLPPVSAAADSAAGGAAAGGAAGPEAEAVPAPAASTPEELYRSAYEDYMRGNYDLASQGFRDYMDRWPSTELTDNALYWIGECHDAQGEPERALEVFTRVLEEYPTSDKAAAAQLKKGLLYLKMGDQAQGVVHLQYVVYEYPGTREADLARERLRSLGLTIR
ncbi:MAG: tol-pal system protein YbgF [Thermoanaerobaculales bacterium]|jgi:tol-pal system protein YbgF|nr:tol-pal system protein YbgF [Thermoanaerobaculales bacterium]